MVKDKGTVYKDFSQIFDQASLVRSNSWAACLAIEEGDYKLARLKFNETRKVFISLKSAMEDLERDIAKNPLFQDQV